MAKKKSSPLAAASWGYSNTANHGRRFPLKLIELAQVSHREVDKAQKVIAETHEYDPDCKKGCDYCCHIPVAVTVPEAFLLAKLIGEAFAPDRQAEVRRRIDEVVAVTAGHPVETRPNVPCPLLDPSTKACSVYEDRPNTCRQFVSWNRECCRICFEETGNAGMIPKGRSFEFASSASSIAVMDHLLSVGLSDDVVEMNRALQIIFDDPAAYNRWVSGEPVFADCVVPQGEDGESRRRMKVSDMYFTPDISETVLRNLVRAEEIHLRRRQSRETEAAEIRMLNEQNKLGPVT